MTKAVSDSRCPQPNVNLQLTMRGNNGRWEQPDKTWCRLELAASGDRDARYLQVGHDASNAVEMPAVRSHLLMMRDYVLSNWTVKLIYKSSDKSFTADLCYPSECVHSYLLNSHSQWLIATIILIQMPAIWIWNIVDKLPIWGITSMMRLIWRYQHSPDGSTGKV